MQLLHNCTRPRRGCRTVTAFYMNDPHVVNRFLHTLIHSGGWGCGLIGFIGFVGFIWGLLGLLSLLGLLG